MKKILLIEDNKDLSDNIVEILSLANYKVVTAANGKEGVELASKEKPDAIICDITMPILDGFGVLHLLSKNEETANIPFIFLTANAEQSDFRKGMQMGADDYLTKPFNDVDLLNAIETRLKKNELLKKEFANNLSGISDFMDTAKGVQSLQELSEKREIRLYKKKDYIYTENSFPKGVYFITKGKVKYFQTNEFGKDLITELHNEGDFFGYVSLMRNEKYTGSAMALEDCEIYIIPQEDFFSLLYRNAEVSRKFIELLSNNLLENQKQLIKIAYNSVRKRVAEALVNLSNKYKKEGESEFSIRIGREDLSNLVGTATETVTRTISEFKSEKYIDVSGSNITILDYDKLANLKN